MRVFVIGTGRCGTVSFREACRHISNYRCGHETRNGLLEYPDQFIEVNAQMRGLVKHVSEKYPDAYWVHLIRDPDTCIPSLAAMGRGIIMEYYGRINPSVQLSPSNADIAYRFYWQENDLIEIQLEHCIPESHRMQIRLETIKDQWPAFWAWIDAEGDFEVSLASWDTPRNTGRERGE